MNPSNLLKKGGKGVIQLWKLSEAQQEMWTLSSSHSSRFQTLPKSSQCIFAHPKLNPQCWGGIEFCSYGLSRTAFDLAGRFSCFEIHCGPVRARGICGVGVWVGTHSRFHGLSGSNGLSGAEDFRERYIETGERRNRCGDGQRREKQKERDSYRVCGHVL